MANFIQQLAQKLFPKTTSPIPNYTPKDQVNKISPKALPQMQADNYYMDRNNQVNSLYPPKTTPSPKPAYVSVANASANTMKPAPTKSIAQKIIPTLKDTNVPKTTKPTATLTVATQPSNAIAAPIANQDYLEKEVLPRTRKYGIPDALAAGQWAAEGRFVNPKNNNWFNLMYDGKVHPYQSLDNHVADYALTLKNLLKNQGIDITSKKDAMEILKLLQSGKTRFEGHQPDPQHYVNLVSSTPEFKKYYKK